MNNLHCHLKPFQSIEFICYQPMVLASSPIHHFKFSTEPQIIVLNDQLTISEDQYYFVHKYQTNDRTKEKEPLLLIILYEDHSQPCIKILATRKKNFVID